MTDQEAIKRLELHKEWGWKASTLEAIDKAIAALSKQIPYKPEPYRAYYGKCKCGAVFVNKNTNYCGNCGQRLDWGGVR